MFASSRNANLPCRLLFQSVLGEVVLTDNKLYLFLSLNAKTSSAQRFWPEYRCPAEDIETPRQLHPAH